MKSFFALLFVFALFASVVPAQTERSKNEVLPTRAKFYMDVLNFASDQEGQTRLDIFIQVPFKEMQFVVSPDGFEANYTVTIQILQNDEKTVATEKIWTEKVSAPEFDNTTSKENYYLSFRSITLPPGEYFIKTTLEDKESKKNFTVDNKFTVRDFSKKPSISDVMILSKPIEKNNKITPNVTRNVYTQKGIPIFFEVYTQTDSTLNLEYLIKDEKNNVIHTASEEQKVAAGKNQISHTINYPSLSMGKYLIEVKMKNQKNEKASISTYKSFVSRWIGSPSNIKDLKLAIDQLAYIATEKEIDHVEDGKNEEERLQRYLEFWKSKDPVPTSEENEVFDEYYRRIEYANQHFSHYTEGWKTDRGMVYIILGAPSNIDRHPFDYDSKPYEVWEYFELNKRFIFIDQSGFGDYRLTTPLYGDDYRYRK